MAEKITLFKQALPNLQHINYYYVEGLLLYASHLQVNDPQQKFDDIYAEGLALANRYYYRWLLYQFESLSGQMQDPYDPDAYPLPEQLDIDGYVQWLIKELR